MRSKFALSFGISIIVVGIIGLNFQLNSVVLFGLSISSLLFTIINIFITYFSKINKSFDFEILYTFPFVVLILFSCFGEQLSKYDFVQNSNNILNVVTFISFGLVFIGEYIKNKQDVIKEKDYILEILLDSSNIYSHIIKIIEKYCDRLKKKNINSKEEYLKLLQELNNFCMEDNKKYTLMSNLLKKNQENYTLEDIKEVYINGSNELNNK